MPCGLALARFAGKLRIIAMAAMSVVDSRMLGKCEDFSGEENDWPGWRFKFEAWIGMLMAERYQDALS